MAKQKVTTKSSKRYTYSSFKGRIDDLRIEPAKNLQKRVHDYVETSHLLASFEHWKEINLSAGFAHFADNAEELIQTLPQIIYHEAKIFELLITSIDKHEEFALEALLDLLAQFCHDLGPDFLKFYERALKSLICLLEDAVRLESSKIFEWGFNCLAYMFKYLSRVLSDDLIPTFNLLFPLLSHSKDYISRFSAEALSFLIRKAKAKSLRDFISFSFKKLRDTTEPSLYDGILILFSETFISTEDALHSKSRMLIDALLDEVLKSNSEDLGVTLFCDVWMNISRHASTENLSPLYDAIYERLIDDMSAQNLDGITRITSTLAFSESGRKIADWSRIVTIAEQILSHGDERNPSSQNLAFLIAVLFRNCDLRALSTHHKVLFESYLQQHTGSFIPFFFSVLTLCGEKALSFNANRYLQQYVTANGKEPDTKLALFLLEMEDRPQIAGKLNLRVPDLLMSSLASMLENEPKIFTEDVLFDIYKRVVIFTSVDHDDTQCSETFSTLVKRILTGSTELTEFVKDVIGHLLLAINGARLSSTILVKVLLERLDELKTSVYFVEGFNKFLGMLVSSDELCEFFESHESSVIDLSDNLLLPDRKIRRETLQLLGTIMKIRGEDLPQILNDCKNLEDLPLTLQNARDITNRIRGMGVEFAKMEATTLEMSFFIKHMFGLLTVRFSPVWDGVYEVIPSIFTKDQEMVWKLLIHFLVSPEKNYDLEYYGVSSTDEPGFGSWSSTIPRLKDTLDAFSTHWNDYLVPDSSIIDIMKKRRGDTNISPQIRSQILKLMLMIPQLAERHSRDIVPFIFNDAESEEVFGSSETEQTPSSGATWTEADRNSLLKVIAKFRNIKAIYKSPEVRDRLMTLLGSRNTDVQKIALEGLLAYRDPVMIKHRDSLKNLLDDALFKDEVTRLLTGSEVIEKAEEIELMPYALRILFGRAQTPSTSGIKKGRKHAVISVLPGLKEEFLTEFFKLGSSKFHYDYFFENGYQVDPSELTLPNLRRMIGYVTILNLSFDVLGSNFSRVISTTLRPLLYTIAVSYCASSQDFKEVHVEKTVSNLRQQSLKSLNNLFQCSGDSPVLLEYMEEIHQIAIEPRLAKFEDENLQQVSSLMKIIVFWSTNTALYPYLYYNDCASCAALMRVLLNENAKEPVLATILKASNDIVSSPAANDEYVGLVTLVAATCLRVLPSLYQKLSDPNNSSIVIDLLLNLVQAGYVQDNETREHLVGSLGLVIKGNFKGVSKKDIIKVLSVISVLVKEYQCGWSDIEDLYVAVSGLYKSFADREIREAISDVFISFGKQFTSIAKVAELLSDLNSYSKGRVQEYDFSRRLSSFKTFNEENYRSYTEFEWLPIINSCLFFVNDKDELAIRTNASHTLRRFVDYINEKPSVESAKSAVEILEQVILPNIRIGLQRFSEELQKEYISVLAYVIQESKFYKGLEDMKPLLFDGDEEANFFANVNHIQLHRRLRAVRRLRDHVVGLSDNSIAHYLMPLIEQYVFSQEEKYRNIGNEALITIGKLSNYLTWNQYKALFRRYISLLKSKPDQMKETVNLLCQISVALRETLRNVRESTGEIATLQKLPKNLDDVDKFIIAEVYPKLSKTLEFRDSETIVNRMPLAEALVNLVLGLKREDTVSHLPGILTSLCQVLRSKSEELRDAVRKTLGSICRILGADYLPFVLKELISALKRGSHIHVLGFTVHHVLKAMDGLINHSDLDASSQMIVRIIMDDLFGSAGEEKDSENYRTTMKEVKVNKCYDTAEMLASNISLPTFSTLLRPIENLLTERINLRNQNKLEELLRRYTLGLKHNAEVSSPEVLNVCFEIFHRDQNEGIKKRSNQPLVIDENKEFFLVNLNFKGAKVQNERTLVNSTLQKFALDLLHAVLFKSRQLLDPMYLDGFVPLLKDSLLSEDESVLVSSLRVLILFVKLNFSEESATVFKIGARKVLNIIKDSPSTSSELCQVGMKYLSSFIRHKDIKLKDSALSYVLGRILPDLNEPHKQGLAFNFLKALVSKHIRLPEIYDVIDSVREIMVTNHTKEIRDVSRSVYYQFLMEYDQSKGRLEKQFRFMVDNLQYPSQDGRQSVMELINLIVNKANAALLSKLSSSFFVALANVLVNDDISRCREMASVLLVNLLQKLDPESLEVVNKYIIAWLKQTEDLSYLSLGLRVYKVYLSAIGAGRTSSLDELALNRVKSCIADSSSSDETKWTVLYTALTVFESYVQTSKDIYSSSFKITWTNVISCLLYPHLWVRQVAARLINHFIDNMDKFEIPLTDSELQIVASRVLRQLGAPSISEDLASVSIKTLLKIAIYWKKHNTKFIHKETLSASESKYDSSLEFMVSRVGAIIRSEENPADSFMSKKSCIQLLALLIQVFDDELKARAKDIILPLFVYLEYDVSYTLNDMQKELSVLAQECLQILEAKLSVSDFTKAYASVKREVLTRRQERKAKRSVLAVTEPEKAARRKLRKHERSREKRKHEKDESGYYQRKNKRPRT